MPETADTAKGIPKNRSWLPLLGSGVDRLSDVAGASGAAADRFRIDSVSGNRNATAGVGARGEVPQTEAAAASLGFEREFPTTSIEVSDEHIPYLKAGVPSVDLIDFDYPAWHTAEDTLDKTSGRSLKVVSGKWSTSACRRSTGTDSHSGSVCDVKTDCRQPGNLVLNPPRARPVAMSA